MLGILAEHGFEIVENEEDADVIIVNTCTFIDSAKNESIECILELSQYKNGGNCNALIVTGCMAQRYKEQILSEMPEVDAVVGTNEYDKIADVIKELDNDKTTFYGAGRVVRMNRTFREYAPRRRIPLILKLRKAVTTTAPIVSFRQFAEGIKAAGLRILFPKPKGSPVTESASLLLLLRTPPLMERTSMASIAFPSC